MIKEEMEVHNGVEPLISCIMTIDQQIEGVKVVVVVPPLGSMLRIISLLLSMSI